MRAVTPIALLTLLAAGCGSTESGDAGAQDASLDAGDGAAVCGNGTLEDGEQCDDGNTVAFDGCEADCTRTCRTQDECSDDDPCNGLETCDEATFVCVSGTVLPLDTPCDTGAVMGTCQLEPERRACIAPGCGNGAPDAGEECDDGANGDDDDGCRDDCRFSCTTDADCGFDGNICDGGTVCTDAHRCETQGALECVDADACTADTCDMLTGCVHTVIDNDGDGESPSLLGACGTDCDDMNMLVSMGATEACNGADDNCDGVPDDGLECPQGADVACDACGFAGIRRCGADCSWATECFDFVYSETWEGNSVDLTHACGAVCSPTSTTWCSEMSDAPCDTISGGPSVEVPPGRYEAEFEFGSGGRAQFRVLDGTRTLATHDHDMLTFRTTAVIPFSVSACGSAIGVRARALDSDALTFMSVTIRRVGEL